MTPDKARSLANDITCTITTLQAIADELLTVYPDNDHDVQLQEEKPKATPLSLEEVRKVLAEKSRDGHTAAIKDLLEKYGATKLSDINPKHFASLLKNVEILQ